MSEERAEKFLELFNKGKEFTEELLKENQRLRYRIAALETEHGTGGASAEDVQRLRGALLTTAISELPMRQPVLM